MEAICGRRKIHEIAADRTINPIQGSQWKWQLLDGANELFRRGNKCKEEVKAKEVERFQQLRRLQMELEWLKKLSAALRSMNVAS